MEIAEPTEAGGHQTTTVQYACEVFVFVQFPSMMLYRYLTEGLPRQDAHPT